MAATSTLQSLSNDIADIVATAAPSVVQVQGGRRPVSGLAYADGVVVTTMRALEREDDLHVRRHDGSLLDAALAGWDPATNLAVLRVAGLDAKPLTPSPSASRPGEFAVAVARSWSNAVTVSAGVISVIGGPLPTGRRRSIDQVIRTTAPMHEGFSGGAFLDSAGRLIGVTTAARIRGLGVVIPADIAWKTAAFVLEHGRPRRGYVGVAVQRVELPAAQRPAPERESALLVLNVAAGSPAARAGVLVGDVLVEFDGQPLSASDELLDLLSNGRIGRGVPVKILRGGQSVDVTVEVGERQSS